MATKQISIFKKLVYKVAALLYYLPVHIAYLSLYWLAKRNMIIDVFIQPGKPYRLENKLFLFLVSYSETLYRFVARGGEKYLYFLRKFVRRPYWECVFQYVRILRPSKTGRKIIYTSVGRYPASLDFELKKGDMILWSFPVINNGDGTAVIRLPPEGFFSSINHAMQNAYLCTMQGMLPRFSWQKPMYKDPGRGNDVWDYFFKQPEHLPSLPEHVPEPVLMERSEILFGKDGKPVQYGGKYFRMPLPPANPPVARQVIKHFYTDLMLPEIKSLTAEIDVDGYVGLHIRAPVRIRRMARLIEEWGHELVHGIPFALYLKRIEEALKHPAATAGKVFLATDSEQIAELFTQALPGVIMLSPAFRTQKGEFHSTRIPVSKYQIGIDVIRDVELLSRCGVLIHGFSSISSFIKSRCPEKPCLNVEYEFYRKIANSHGCKSLNESALS